MSKVYSVEFLKYDEDLIKITLINRAGPNILDGILGLRKAIQSLLNIIGNDEFPDWFCISVEEIIKEFLRIIKFSETVSTPQMFNNLYLDFRDAIFYNIKKNSSLDKIFYSLPFLENYAKTYQIQKNTTEDSINIVRENVAAEINSLEGKFNAFKAEADITLSLLNKQAGKIGVKDYAEIFEKQAFEHSRFVHKDDLGKRKFKGLGKAQLWLLFALIAFILLIFYFTQLDTFFSLKDQYIFTPEVIVHIVGRFLLISLFIFIVSFSFKQFRINMHLYTLNKHRANTLKSFEYLTRAPDKLEPSSYNAILMEVAKAIYESGQTGYINPNDSHADMPSIIDMSKVITQPKT